jgi:hypothetical protein
MYWYTAPAAADAGPSDTRRPEDGQADLSAVSLGAGLAGGGVAEGLPAGAAGVEGTDAVPVAEGDGPGAAGPVLEHPATAAAATTTPARPAVAVRLARRPLRNDMSKIFLQRGGAALRCQPPETAGRRPPGPERCGRYQPRCLTISQNDINTRLSPQVGCRGQPLTAPAATPLGWPGQIQ